MYAYIQFYMYTYMYMYIYVCKWIQVVVMYSNIFPNTSTGRSRLQICTQGCVVFMSIMGANSGLAKGVLKRLTQMLDGSGEVISGRPLTSLALPIFFS